MYAQLPAATRDFTLGFAFDRRASVLELFTGRPLEASPALLELDLPAVASRSSAS